MSDGKVSINDAMRIAVGHHNAGRIDLAENLYAQILAVVPGHHEALRMSGLAAQQRGNPALAIAQLRKSIAARPTVMAHFNLGVVLVGVNRRKEALLSFEAALALDPDNVKALTWLGVTLKELGRHAEAIVVFERLLPLAPDAFDSHAPYAQSLQETGRLEEALAHYRRALELVPDHANAWCNLGMTLLAQGKPAEAQDALRRSLALDPAPHVHSNLLFALMFDAACTPEQYLDEARRFGAAVTAAARPFTDWRVGPPGTDIATLRVGFVSGDLRVHAVGFFLENFVAQFDRQRVQLVAYSTVAHEDELTARLKPAFVEWHDISALSDEAAARKIRDDGIHVLVDLAGHTAHNRLPVFAWRPAPVQVTWLGFSASSGVPAIDWLPVDEVSVPASARNLYTERLWYLPDTRVCFTPPAEAPEVASLPALDHAAITFGCFQAMTKLGDPVLDLWAQILARVPHARLRIQNGEMDAPAAREKLLARLAQRGVAAGRIVMVGKMPRADYLAAHAAVDIILDTFPYPGGTTTCEALWMGVPTLTFAGRTLLQRYGASALTAAGLADWVAVDADDYVAKAVTHAADIARLATLRAGLREQVRLSPLCDGALFAHRFADALHGMWRAGQGESAAP